MTVQNGPVEERLHSATSAVVISMEPLMKEALVKNNNSLIYARMLGAKMGSAPINLLKGMKWFRIFYNKIVNINLFF